MSSEREEIRRALQELADDPAAEIRRRAVCDVTAGGLARLGHLLWVNGALLGRQRGPTFRDERVVGIATVAQIGGELGTVALLEAGNLYSAAALVRQLVEVEYLAAAFGEDHDIAAQWLRADRDERRQFWSPARLRKRAQGRFLSTDYWHHCDIGGHPATPGMQLLPGHSGQLPAIYWADLAGHLQGVWRGVFSAATEGGAVEIPESWQLPDVNGVAEAWVSTDGLWAALQDLGAILHEDF
jgi:hypothetical protein